MIGCVNVILCLQSRDDDTKRMCTNCSACVHFLELSMILLLCVQGEFSRCAYFLDIIILRVLLSSALRFRPNRRINLV